MNKWLAGIFWLIQSTHVFGQAEWETNSITSGQLSPEFCSYNRVSDKLVFQFAVQAGFSNDTNQKSFNIVEHLVQYGGRVLLHLALSPRLKASVGGGVWSNPEVPEAGQYNYNEFRSFVQIKHYLTPPRTTLTNRLRLEQRFVQNKENTAYEYKPRIRYSPKVVYALNSKVIRAKTVHAYGMGEIFMTPDSAPFVKQIRLLIGFGYNFNSDVSVEVDYGFQRLYFDTDPNFKASIIGVTLNMNNILK